MAVRYISSRRDTKSQLRDDIVKQVRQFQTMNSSLVSSKSRRYAAQEAYQTVIDWLLSIEFEPVSVSEEDN